MGLITTIVLFGVPILLILAIVFTFIVVKKIIKIGVWVALVVLVIGSIVIIYSDATGLDQNTLVLYEKDGEFVNGFVTAKGDADTPIDIEQVTALYEGTPEALYEAYHKVVIIEPTALDHLEKLEVFDGTIDQSELSSRLDAGEYRVFFRAYDDASSPSWYIRHLKDGDVRVEPESLTFTLARYMPRSFAGEE